MPAVTDALARADGEAAIRALLERHGLAGAAVAAAFFSFTSPYSFIGAHDPDGRITPLIEFLPLPVRGAELLAAIAAIDENGPPLVANFGTAFPEVADSLSAFGADLEPGATQSLHWLLSACSLVLWLEAADVAKALARPVEAVKIDTVVIERDGRHLFDGRRLLRSLMSYRIADVPNHVLACSVFGSLGEFAAEAIRLLLRDWKATAAVCAGDLFARNRILRQHARASMLRLRVPVYFPPDGDR